MLQQIAHYRIMQGHDLEQITARRGTDMSDDFIRIHSLQGELKISHKLRDLGITVSTEEIVIQKPHINYHIPLDQIISIHPYQTSIRDFSYENRQDDRTEIVRIGNGLKQYNLYADGTVMHNRSGIFHVGRMQFILPIHEELLQIIGRYSKLQVIV